MSEIAMTLAALVADTRAFPEDAARDLMRLVGHTLAEPDVGTRRWDMLRTVVIAIERNGGKLPTVREYEAFRAQHNRDAPAAASLAERYGTWLAALVAASRLLALSRSSPVWPHKLPRHPPYTPAQCLAALAQFRKRFGDWPGPTEYREWSRSARRAARECGGSDPNLPDLKVILKRFGTFDRALEAASSMYGDIP